MMEEKAQVHLEYLLIAVGVVVTVTIVALYIKETANSAAQATIEQANQNP